MILVGKIGKTKAYEASRKPTDLEMHGLSFDELHKQFGPLWVSTPERVPPGIRGEVVESTVEIRTEGQRIAVVRVKVDAASQVNDD